MKDWRIYVSKFENQIQDDGPDPQTCITAAVQSAVSILQEDGFHILDADYSRRFTGLMSGTGNGGNTILNVIESVKRDGLVLEEIFPTVGTVPIFTIGEVQRRGQMWKKEWLFNAKEILDPIQGLKSSPVLVTVFAWAFDGGAYIDPLGIGDNHVCLLLYADEEYFYVLDSYDPFIKKLRRNYKFDRAFSFSIKKRTIWNTLICG